MGSTMYNAMDRSVRADSLGYFSKSTDETFTQQKVRRIHKDMDPNGVSFRECRDSDVHPNAFPVQFYLDLTGSMGDIPALLVKDGLPSMMTTIIQRGTPDVALLFGGVGDHEADRYPLQVGQFESGDAELDMWLTRTFLEGGGGSNAGESYALAWYFAAFHTVTDAWEKRSQKGVVITCGDEPDLRTYPISAIKSLMGTAAVGQATYTEEELYKAASEKNHVYHISIEHGSTTDNSWRTLLGENLIVTKDYTEVPKIVADIVLKHSTGVQWHLDTTDRQDSGNGENITDDIVLL